LSQAANDSGFLRHVRACNNARLPGDRLPFRIGAAPIGWVAPAFGRALAALPSIEVSPDGVTLGEPAALPAIARKMAENGYYRWRREEFDVRSSPSGPVLARIDRGAIPSFGIQATGVHMNGLVRRADGLHVWVARRAWDKLLDPGKLDHIVAGGVPAGLTPLETLVKEAGEEAAIAPRLAAQAREVAQFSYAMERPEGLRRDHLHCFDLALPEEFVPHAADGEVESFELWPLQRVAQTVRATDDFKFNVNLVLIDLLIREDFIAGAEATALRAALAAGTI
jgi:8-oxo-dGTP pyrophosphatase MutT (NUDIX family)